VTHTRLSSFSLLFFTKCDVRDTLSRMTTKAHKALVLFGNGAKMHDRIAGKPGDYATVEAGVRAGRQLVIGVVRDNAFFLDKIADYAAKLIGRSITALPLAPSPVSELPRRFEFHLDGLNKVLGAHGILMRVMDDDLREIIQSAARNAGDLPEADILRLLGIVCRTALVGPHWFVFEVENSCNENCLYCNIHSPERKPSKEFIQGRMPFAQYAAQVRELARMGVDGVTVLGNGEPTVHPDFLEMVLLPKKLGLRVNFFTNGLLLTQELSRRVVDAGCDEMFCTISGGSKKSYGILHPRQGEKGYDRVLENLRFLFQYRSKGEKGLPKASAVHVVCAANARELPAMAEQAVDLGFDAFRPQLIRVDEHNQKLALSDEDLSAIARDLPAVREICEKGGVELWEAFEPMVRSARDNPDNWTPDEFIEQGCIIGWLLGLAKCDGTLSLCCVVKPVGHLADGGIEKLWSGADYQRYRLAALDLKQNRDMPLLDGSPLFTERCRRCDNHDINRRYFSMLRESGMIRHYRQSPWRGEADS